MDDGRQLDLETNVKRIVSEEVTKSQNDFLSRLDSLFTAKFQVFDRIHSDLQRSDDYKFQRKSCEDQFKFNKKVTTALKEADLSLDPRDEASAKAKQKISEGIDLMNYRQKLVKMADSSECGWKLVQEYTANPLADDSDDDKKILRAQARAERKIKADKMKRRRYEPYYKRQERPSAAAGSETQQQKNVKPGVCYRCYKPGHWQNECTEKRQPKLSICNMNLESCSSDILIQDFALNSKLINSRSNSAFKQSNDVKLSDNLNTSTDQEILILTPVGQLRKSILKWKEVGTSDYILKVIEIGYGIPFKNIPDSCIIRNNKSSMDNPDFVVSEIDKLLKKRCISEVSDVPKVVNPLTVAYCRSGKPRLVLDCRHINKCIHQFKFKFEDGTVAKQLFKKGDFLFKFDLKSAYHHVEIFDDHRTYLGFCWNSDGKDKYYVFNVLPFGIASAGHIFTKLMKEVVKYWRSKGYKILMYLDDGLGGDSDFDTARQASTFIRQSLIDFGFLIADEKCIWLPTQNMIWIGLSWDMKYGLLRISDERITRLMSAITSFLNEIYKGKLLHSCRFVACIVGQIISMMPVMENVCRLKTRALYDCIILRASWNSLIFISAKAIEELHFWQSNLVRFNQKGLSLHESNIYDILAFSDASELGTGGYLMSIEDESACDYVNESVCDSKYVNESVCDSVISSIEYKSSKTDCCLDISNDSLHTVVSSWSENEKVKSSTWRELEAVSRLVKGSVDILRNHSVNIHTDNKNVFSIIKNGSRKTDLQEVASDLYDFCFGNNIRVDTQWIPREQNKVADDLSRYSDSDDWGIKNHIFVMLDDLWGVHTIDRFATDYNAKCVTSLLGSLSSHLLDSRSDNTTKKYYYGFLKWDKFVKEHNLISIPASPVHVSLYLTFLLDSGCTYSSICTAVYSIKWAHDMCGKVDPTDNLFVKSLVESAKRMSKPVLKKKDPVNTDILINLCTMFQFSSDLLVVRDLLLILLGYSGFLRFNELSQLRCNDFIVYEDHLVIKIRRSKTDQYRAGDQVLISKGHTLACPYNMFLRYVNIAGLGLNSDMFLFRPVYRSKDVCNLVKVNKAISYTTARECVIKRLKLVAPNLNLGLHSLRSGGASMAANSGVNDRCWKRHGRWKSDSSKDGYVADSVENKLSVSRSLGL